MNTPSTQASFLSLSFHKFIFLSKFIFSGAFGRFKFLLNFFLFSSFFTPNIQATSLQEAPLQAASLQALPFQAAFFQATETPLFNSSIATEDIWIAAVSQFQEGDLIFQKSQTSQSMAILEATQSEWSHVGILVKFQQKWYVAEAIQPVTMTELTQWVARGKNKSFVVKRHISFKAEMIPQIYLELKKYLGLNYDIYFEWNDERIYCSELVYKVFDPILHLGIGQIQKFKELKLDGPFVQELIKKRYTDLGKPLNPEEAIVTPISQMNDPNLKTIFIQ